MRDTDWDLGVDYCRYHIDEIMLEPIADNLKITKIMHFFALEELKKKNWKESKNERQSRKHDTSKSI